MTAPDLPIYLDHNASTPILPEVLQAMLPFLRDHHGNPSSTHPYGARLRDAVAGARGRVAGLLGCSAEEIVFTSGGTEANNLAICGTAAAHPNRPHIVTSVIEHPASAAPCADLERRGYRITRIPVDRVGRVDLDAMLGALGDAPPPALVTIMYANSETGTLQPIREIVEIAREVGALVHSDAAQACGKVAVDVNTEGVDLLSLAGHKLYAPKGVGALFLRAGTRIEPVLRGAGHERGIRPGTENVASIVGLGAACEIATRDLAEEGARVGRLRDRLRDRLRAEVPGLVENGDPDHRLPNTLNVRFPGVSGNALLGACPTVAASTGSACHAGEDHPSDVILAMGVPADEALGSVRLSLGRGTTETQIERAATDLAGAWQMLTTNPGP